MNEAWRKHPTLGLELELTEVFVRRAWCRATASPGCQEAWSENNPAFGQCAVTTALLWESLKEDGIDTDILRAEVQGFGSHYWLRLPDGTEVDMTRSQFPEGTVIPNGQLRTIDYLLDSERAQSARTRERMQLLIETSEHLFANWLFESLLGKDSGSDSEDEPVTLASAVSKLEKHVEGLEARTSPQASEDSTAKKE